MKLIAILIFLNSSFFLCFAQIDTIGIKRNNLRTKYLVESHSIYLNWLKDTKSGMVSNISISKRDIFLRKMKGKNVIVVIQRKLNNDTNKIKFIYTVNDRENFRTYYDYLKGAEGIEAYDYRGNEIKGTDTIPQNSKLGFHLTFSQIPYCLELDLETIRALPIKKIGQKMAICFYQPGREKLPGFQPVEVIRQEQLPTSKGNKADCWIVKLTIDNDNYDLFWITKLKHEFLKLESHGLTDTFYKIKIFNENLIL